MSEPTEVELNNELKDHYVDEERSSISSVVAINDQTLDEIDEKKKQNDKLSEEPTQGQPEIDPDVDLYMRACQEGNIEVIKELFRSEKKIDAHTLDPDGVSGLHWASINNRLATVKYLVENGAEVDLRGGDLLATPLHWACRYGLVYIADYLIRELHSDPAICDRQGFNSLHLAVHSSNIMLVIYLLNFAPTIPVDSSDPSGRTLLHWAAYQGDTLSVDLLLKNGANVNVRDDTKFTLLHWSLIRGTTEIIKNLIENGSSVHDKNADGKDCFDIAVDMNCSSKLQMALKLTGFDKNGNAIKRVMSPKTAKVVTFFQPYLLLLLVFLGKWSVPKFLLTCLFVLGNHALLMKVIVPCYVLSSNPLIRTPYMTGLFSATAFWTLLTWSGVVLSKTFAHLWFLNIALFVFASITVSTFFKAMLINPGYIPKPVTKDVIRENIVELIKLGKYDSKHFCIYTYIRKPLRSKFSWYSKKNVARFDHYCPWIFNEVGVRNHKLFAAFTYSLQLTIVIYIYLVYNYFTGLAPLKDALGQDEKCSLLSSPILCSGYQTSPFIFNLSVWACIQLLWLSLLVFVQTFQILRGITSWEASNIHQHSSTENGANPYYSSVPSDIAGSGSVNGTVEAGESQHPVPATSRASSGSKFGCFAQAFSKSVISKLLGIDQFLMTAQDAMTLKKSLASTNYGLKTNFLDFWFLRNEELGEKCGVKTLLRLPIAGEANLNGQLVDYYKLWELPRKDGSIV